MTEPKLYGGILPTPVGPIELGLQTIMRNMGLWFRRQLYMFSSKRISRMFHTHTHTHTHTYILANHSLSRGSWLTLQPALTCASQPTECRQNLYRLGNWDASVMPLLEYAGGVRFYYCYYTSTSVSRTLNGAFPGLLRVGPSGLYIWSVYATSMNSAFTNLVRIDGYMYLYGAYIQTYTRYCCRQYGSYCYRYCGRYDYTYSTMSSISNSFSSLQSVGSYMYVSPSSIFVLQFNSINRIQTHHEPLYKLWVFSCPKIQHVY